MTRSDRAGYPPLTADDLAEMDRRDGWIMEVEARQLITALRASQAELEWLREEYDQLSSDAAAEVGRLRIKAGEEPIALCWRCDHPVHEGECSRVCFEDHSQDVT